MASTEKLPLVSIGLPVYNGDKVIKRAVDSILAQDYPNFEFIISDDASTDETPEICREYAQRDKRVVFYQGDKNRGEIWNSNRVFNLARGKYFTLFSQDDLRAPQFISKCVERLENNENAVSCSTYSAVFLGDPENVLAIITQDTMEGIHRPWERFVEALKTLPASTIHGVFRTDMLRRLRTNLFENYISSDIVRIQELTLYGEFLQVPEVLSWISAMYMRPSPQEEYITLVRGKSAPRFYFPFVVVLQMNARSIQRSPLPILLKGLLWSALLHHTLTVVFAKVLFRSAVSLMGGRCPMCIIRYATRIIDNPNIRLVKPIEELNPQLQPTWLLFNHRSLEKAEGLQKEIVSKLLKQKEKRY